MVIGRVVRTIQVEPLPEEVSAAVPGPEIETAQSARADGHSAGLIRDRLGAIVGHRVWGCVSAFKPGVGSLRESVLLSSLNGITWNPREPIEAKCTLVGGAPHNDCSCGIYALKASHLPFQMMGEVTGEVYLWGKVIECEGGYRAQFAYPKKLTVAGDERVARLLAEAYGVEVIGVPAPGPMRPPVNLPPFVLQPFLYSTPAPEGVAEILAAVLREKGSVELQAVGAAAVNRAIKATASARGYVMELGAADLS